MPEPYESIYLSPHFDDVVLSCGAQIFQHIRAGHSVMIVTVMAGDPPHQPLSDYAQALHSRWQINSKSVTARRKEDKAACALLGTEYLHWPIPDCIYRRNPESGEPLYISDDDIFGGIDPVEEYLLNTIKDQIENLPIYSQLVAPLSVGNHVDHQLVRKAAELAQDGSQLVYYEEYPYITKAKDQEMVFLTGRQGKSETIDLSNEAVRAKIQAIRCYQSQISTFYSDIQDFGQQITLHTLQVGGERLWRLS